jgi:hypothetical protein
VIRPLPNGEQRKQHRDRVARLPLSLRAIPKRPLSFDPDPPRNNPVYLVRKLRYVAVMSNRGPYVPITVAWQAEQARKREGL